MEHEIGADESVSAAVVRAVSAVRGRGVRSIPPLTTVLDPDALDALFHPRASGEPRVGGRISFVYDNCRVTVDNGEYLTVRALGRLPRIPGDREPGYNESR